jgi:SNF2 family DNA or RNA helicase
MVKYTPLKFQEEAIVRMVKAGSQAVPCGLILADEMGLGKTSEMLEAIHRLILLKESKAVLEGDSTTTSSSSTDEIKSPITWDNNNLCYLILAPKSMISSWQKEGYFVNTKLGEMTLICKEKLGGHTNGGLGGSKNRPTYKHRILITTPGLLRTAGWPHVQHLEANDLETFIDKQEQEDTKYADVIDDSSATRKKKAKARARIAAARAAYKAKVAMPWFYKKVWDGVVLDEAHETLANGVKCTGRGKFLENFKMKAARCVYYLKKERGWALTGTPIKNKISDLVALAKFVLADRHEFGSCDHWNKPAPGDKGDDERRKLIRDFATEFMIRRTDELLNLPKMHKKGVACRMSKIQEQNAIHDMHTAMGLLKELEKKKGVEKAKYHMALLAMINRLRLNNSSPFLLKNYGGVSSKNSKSTKGTKGTKGNKGKRASDVTKKRKGEEQISANGDDEEDTEMPNTAPWPKMDSKEILDSSPKLAGVCDLTRQVLKDGEQIIIFSFAVQTLKLLAKLLKDTVMPRNKNGEGREPPIFTGSTSGDDRDKMVADFQSGKERVLLLSCKAGGLGITLTAATNVALLDPWWHPFVEFQAIKRAHRKGQTKEVKMYRFVMDGEESIDLWMLGLQKSKLEDAKILMPDLDRYSDCFILGSDKVNLVSEFRNWIIEWCRKYEEDIGKIVSSSTTTSRKARSPAKGTKGGKRKSCDVDDDDYSPEAIDDDCNSTIDVESGSEDDELEDEVDEEDVKAPTKRKLTKRVAKVTRKRTAATSTRRSTRKAAAKKIDYTEASDDDSTFGIASMAGMEIGGQGYGNVCWRCKHCSHINDQVDIYCSECNAVDTSSAATTSNPVGMQIEC